MLSGQEASVCTFDRLIQCSVALCLNVFFALHSSCLASDVSAVHSFFIVCAEGTCLTFKLLSKFHNVFKRSEGWSSFAQVLWHCLKISRMIFPQRWTEEPRNKNKQPSRKHLRIAWVTYLTKRSEDPRSSFACLTSLENIKEDIPTTGWIDVFLLCWKETIPKQTASRKHPRVAWVISSKELGTKSKNNCSKWD